MRIAICDSRADVSDMSEIVLRSVCKKERIRAHIELFSSTEKLLDRFKSDKYSFDLVLLYSGMSGMKATECAGQLRKLNNSFRLVFLTSYEINIYKLFRYNISTIIPRFMSEEYMTNEFTRIIRDIENEKGEYLAFKIRVSENGFAERKIRISDIMYMTVVDRKIYIKTRKDTYELKRRGFSELKDLMVGYNFIEISRFYVVNMEYVRFIEGNEMVLDNGTILNISRRQLKGVTDAFSDMFESELLRKHA